MRLFRLLVNRLIPYDLFYFFDYSRLTLYLVTLQLYLSYAYGYNTIYFPISIYSASFFKYY